MFYLDHLPEQIHRYQIKRILNKGGMGIIFLAYDPNIEREVVIKMLLLERIDEPNDRIRFFREARLVAALEDEAIVPVYDFFEQDHVPYLVMRYMPGGSLAEKLARGPLPLAQAVQILGRIAPALDRVHAQGIIHRDLKPANILFDQHGKAYLADFGIAKVGSGSNLVTRGDLTGEVILGTLAYMSPEQFAGADDLDGRSDLYALGIILFEMLSGRRPYQAQDPLSLIGLHCEAPVPSLLAIEPGLPAALEAIIAKSLAKDRRERYAYAAALAADLRQAAEGFVDEAARTSPQPKSGGVITGASQRESTSYTHSAQEVCGVCGMEILDPSKACPTCGSWRRLNKPGQVK